MSFKKVLFTSLTAISLSSVSVLAHADLVIQNNTNKASTSKINGKCSSWLSGGITEPHSKNVVSSTTIKFACGLFAKTCVADVYMTRDCSGPRMANIVLDLKSGITSATAFIPSYKITYHGFYIQVDGGQALAWN